MRSRRRLPRAWPPEGGPYRDDRLAFLAAEPQLRRIARRGGSIKSVLAGLGVPGGSLGIYGRHARKRMLKLGLACNEAAKRLDAFERLLLQESGELPAWFLPDVERLAQRLRLDTRAL